MAHVSACSLLALLASRVRRVTFLAFRGSFCTQRVSSSARSAWLALASFALLLCLCGFRVSRGRFTLPSRLRVSAVALSAFAITRLGRCSLPSRVSRLGPLCLRGFRVSALSAFASFASRPLCTLLAWLTLSVSIVSRLGLSHTSSVAHSSVHALAWLSVHTFV
jgi:hypothetical protein